MILRTKVFIFFKNDFMRWKLKRLWHFCLFIIHMFARKYNIMGVSTWWETSNIIYTYTYGSVWSICKLIKSTHNQSAWNQKKKRHLRENTKIREILKIIPLAVVAHKKLLLDISQMKFIYRKGLENNHGSSSCKHAYHVFSFFPFWWTPHQRQTPS